MFILRARVAPRRPPEWAGLLPFTIIGVGRFLSRRRSRYLSGNAGVEFSPVFLGQRELGIVVVFPPVVNVKAKKYRPSLFWLDRRPARRCIPCPKIYRSNPCCCLHHSRESGEVSGKTGGKRNERDKVGEQGGTKRSTEIQFQHMDTKTTSVYVCFFEATGCRERLPIVAHRACTYKLCTPLEHFSHAGSKVCCLIWGWEIPICLTPALALIPSRTQKPLPG